MFRAMHLFSDSGKMLSSMTFDVSFINSCVTLRYVSNVTNKSRRDMTEPQSKQKKSFEFFFLHYTCDFTPR